MKVIYRYVSTVMLTLVFIPFAQAQVYLAPWIGFTGGGEVETNQDHRYNIDPSASYALSVETDYQTGRLGLFYSYQSSEVEEIGLEAEMQYLMLQSSLYYETPMQVAPYIGIGVGMSYASADWVDNNLGFATSIFGGFDYPLAQNVSFNTQFRWLGTVVDSDSRAACNLPAGANADCVIQFKSDWMNQFTMSFGVVMHF
ncbi:porin family protein [Vibrio taketomensis]|uniref:porin family protein n=1 Tax=Vibrio taketomensis TaxID=2572923 RepID=UPI001E4CF385|nr:porin family protein [Vibrio taketomensis]